MRLIPTQYLNEGDIIARDIISYEGGILLRHHTRFKEAFKDKLIERNITEVYIEDEISKGIEPSQLLTNAARSKMTSDIKLEFDKLQKNLDLDLESMNEITRFLMEQIDHKEMIVELEDLYVNDTYTYEHCLGVAILTNVVCNKMNICVDLKEQIVMGALVHDIGKIILPKDILNKPGKLTSEEYEMIKSHAELGYHMIKDNTEISAITKLAVLCHHEREDGTGYPLKKGPELHVSAKILGVCDLYHALISDRCYRKGLPINEVVTIAQREAINPDIRNIVESCFCYYPVGSMVMLSDGNIAIVEKNFEADIKRPLVRILEKNYHNKYEASYRINLQENKKVHIVKRHYGNI